MSLKENLLELLQKNSGEFLSGEKAAETLGVSRTAVWKAVTALKNEGYNFAGTVLELQDVHQRALC